MIDWAKEKSRINDMLEWRKKYECFYGFEPPKGAEMLWSWGYDTGYERGKSNGTARSGK